MYEYTDDGTILTDPKGEKQFLCNFTATITHEIRYVDTAAQQTRLTIIGKCKGKKLPPVDINAKDFPSMSWVMTNWGVRPSISPVPNAERHIRAAIQQNSDPKTETIYTHTGWHMIGNEEQFLTADGAVGQKGLDRTIKVELPSELKRFSIIPDTTREKDAINATLALSALGPKSMTWPLIAATMRPVIGPVDYAVHVSGQTGTFKSELSSLMQSHYGPLMDARHLPGSWSSTANALEAQAYKCKNAIFCIDDFVPNGSSWQIKALQKTADQIVRAQGNQAGRARLTDVSSHQTTMYPRGMILSTGEDIPTNHSIRARMLILDLTPGDVDKNVLTIAQRARPLYQVTTAAWIKWIAKLGVDKVAAAVKSRREEIRDKNQDVGHTRTPTTLGDLQSTIALFLAFAQDKKAIDQKTHDEYAKEAAKGILDCCNEQEQHLTNADPCETFCDVIRQILGAQQAHFRSMDGSVPANPEALGWTVSQSQDGIRTFKANGPKMGWVNTTKDEIYLDANSAYPLIMRFSRGTITATKQTMLKRLKDQGVLVRTDDARKRNTVRVTAENTPKNVLVMRLSQILQTNEVEK